MWLWQALEWSVALLVVYIGLTRILLPLLASVLGERPATPKSVKAQLKAAQDDLVDAEREAEIARVNARAALLRQGQAQRDAAAIELESAHLSMEADRLTRAAKREQAESSAREELRDELSEDDVQRTKQQLKKSKPSPPGTES